MNRPASTGAWVFVFLSWVLIAGNVASQSTNIYHTNRVFDACISGFSGVTSAYRTISGAALLTELVGPTSVVLDAANTRAIEYESGAWGYESAQAAWTSALAAHTAFTNLHDHVFFENAGWVKGTKETDNTWGAYFWYLQNQLAFRSSTTNAWVSPRGVTGYFVRVHVGSLGDYAPMTNYTDVGPTNWADITHFLGAGNWTDTAYRANLETYYQLLMTCFGEDTQQLYGFDFFSDPKVFYKSVETGKTDTVFTQITPTDYFAQVSFRSTNTAAATVNPSGAGSPTQTLFITGGIPGTSEIQANGGTADGPRTGRLIAKCFAPLHRTLAIRVIHEENDDIQMIDVGTTGLLSTAQVTGSGDNLFCDSVPAGDDIPTAHGVLAGPNGIAETHALNSNIITGPIDLVAVSNWLAKTYGQAVCSWTVEQLPDMAVNFDTNRDGNVDSEMWDNDELYAIKGHAFIPGVFDYTIFVVDNPTDGRMGGYMAYPGQVPLFAYGFVFGNTGYDTPSTVAHELGHGAFTLDHREQPLNLMSTGRRQKWRLQYDQWEEMRD